MGGSFSVRTPEEFNFDAAPSKVQSEDEKKKLKPCCACPETKKARDECIMKNGEKNCRSLIEAHIACMRSKGFEI